jgi:hypothetical protein
VGGEIDQGFGRHLGHLQPQVGFFCRGMASLAGHQRGPVGRLELPDVPGRKGLAQLRPGALLKPLQQWLQRQVRLRRFIESAAKNVEVHVGFLVSFIAQNASASPRTSRIEQQESLHAPPMLIHRMQQLAQRSSSLRVPERLMFIAGKMRFSAMRRSRWISMLPVPLNSSKITSSIFEPVSISAVARIVRLPPSSMLRAAPKKRFGLLQGVGVDAAGEHLAGARHHGVVGAGQAGDGVEQDDHVLLVLDEALGLLDHHFGDLHVAGGRLVERADDTTSPFTVRCMSVTSSGRSSMSSTMR